jgi:HAD superfamily phosphatase (TIGR01668 family)
MSFSLLPQYSFSHIEDITPALLQSQGVELLMLDLDNTISPYTVDLPSEALLRWTEDMKQGGIRLFILSNSRSDTRVRRFAEAMDIGFISRAGKPRRRGAKKVLGMLGLRPEQAALAGDQIFTDVLAANRSGMLSILVEPLLLNTFLFRVRYIVEGPFRRRSRYK